MTIAENDLLIDYVKENFDPDYYVNRYPDIKKAGVDPVKHYLVFGYKENRNPNDKFDASWYKSVYIKNDTIPSIIDYLNKGKCFATTPYSFSDIKKMCIEKGVFSNEYYLASNPDVAASGYDPFEHYCKYGWKELRNPSDNFDNVWYTLNNMGGFFENNPLIHYIYR